MEAMEWKFVVIPQNDARPHIDSVHCSCNPEVKDEVLVHNAFDGRDRQERYDEEHNTKYVFPSIMDCRQLGDLILIDTDNKPLSFCSPIEFPSPDVQVFELCTDEGPEEGSRYRVIIKIEELS